MKHSRVTAGLFAAALNPLRGLKALAALSPLAVLAVSLAAALPARGSGEERGKESACAGTHADRPAKERRATPPASRDACGAGRSWPCCEIG